MLKELSSSLMDNSIYHIIEFNDGKLSDQATFFVVNINEYGFVKADIVFPEELDVMNILPMVQRIHYHRIDLLKPDTTEITEKVRIKVVFSEYTRQIILEADDQCWYVGVDNGFFSNFYYQRTLELLLFMQTLPKLYNGETEKVTYASFYETQYRYLNHIRRHRYKNFKSEEKKEAYKGNAWSTKNAAMNISIYFTIATQKDTRTMQKRSKNGLKKQKLVIKKEMKD